MQSSLNDFCRVQRGLLGPTWREQLARSLPARVDRSNTGEHDRLVLDRRQYLTICETDSDGPKRAAKKFPLLAAAEALAADSNVTAVAKVMVVGDLPPEEIHRRLCVEPAVLDTWERLFFDVREQRDAQGWMAAHVIDPERKYGDPALAPRLKMALVGGAVAVAALLDGAAGLPLDEAGRLFDRRLKQQLKFDQAIQMPLDSSSEAFAYVKLQAELKLAEQRLDLAERKLAQRCVEAVMDSELNKVRLDLQHQRAQAKEAQRQVHVDRARQREEAKRQRRQAAVLCARAQQAAELAARTERIASSPLARLKWGSAAGPLANDPAALPTFRIDAEREADTPHLNVSKQHNARSDHRRQPQAIPA